MQKNVLWARLAEIDACLAPHRQSRELKQLLKEIYAEPGARDRIRDNFRILMAYRNITYANLGEEVGSDPSVVGRILNAQVVPSTEMMRVIVQALGVQLSVLLEADIAQCFRDVLQQLNVEAVERSSSQ